MIEAFIVKHAIADLALQPFLPQGSKARFGAKTIHHALHHGGLTLLIALALTTPITALAIAVLDAVLHASIDAIKTKGIEHFSLTQKDKIFMSIQAIDQLMHYSCYLLYIALINALVAT